MTTTRLVCTIAVIVAALYDVVALQLWGVDGSISHWFGSFSGYPVPVFAVGFLCGHFFGKMAPIKPAGVE